MNASHLDPQLVDKIVHEVKSQGVFDDFRKDTLADVDTKPAYQNLRHRVESTVKKFLSEQKWTPETNKYQLREKLRRHITESGFLDVGVERIVDQVVNPKIGSVFQPRIEEIAYKYLGIPPPPPVKNEPPPPPMIHPLPPLPLNGSSLKVETSNLLPTDLEQVSPDSDKATVKSEFKEDSLMDMDVDDKLDEDEESPPFEPLIRCTSPIAHHHSDNYEPLSDGPPGVDSPRKSEVSQQVIEDTVIQSGVEVGTLDAESQDTSMSMNTLEMDSEKETSRSMDCVVPQESQLSQVSSDTNSSTQSAGASKSPANESAAVNISEEAQMPKFNDNSSEAYDEKNSKTSQLHFDIKKDEIKFEGTERKSSLIPPDSIKAEPYVEHDDVGKHVEGVKVETQSNVGNGSHEGTNDDTPLKEADNCFKFEKVKEEIEAETAELATQERTEIETETEVDVEAVAETSLTPIPDQSFGSSQDETCSAQQSIIEKSLTDFTVVDDKNDAIENATQMETNPSVQSSKQKDDKDVGKSSSSSSFRHKKHAKDKHRSHDKDKDKEKDRDRDRDRDRERDKEKDRERNRDKDRNRERERDRERGRDKERERDKIREREKHRSGDRDRSRDKYGRSKHSSSSSSKQSSSNAKSSSTETGHKIEKTSGSTKPTTIQLSNSSSSSSRSEVSSLSADVKRNDRRNENDKKQKSILSTSSNGTKKSNGDNKSPTEQTIDDHNVSRERSVRKKSTDSNDDDKTPETGTQSNANATITTANGKSTTTKQAPKQQQQQQSNESNTKCSQNSQQLELLNNPHANKVVILNDILENPATNFIELEAASSRINHVQIITSTTNGPCTTIMLPTMDVALAEDAEIPKDDLLFFEEATDQFSERLTLLNSAMAECRWLLNSLSIDTVFSGQNTLYNAITSQMKEEEESSALLLTDSIQCRNSNSSNNNNESKNISKMKYNNNNNNNADETINIESNVYAPLCKRFKHNIDGALNTNETSPTPSDISANSKENETFDKNVVTQKVNVNTKKISQQQRYTSEDLYKPRSILRQRSRRRDLDSIL